MDRRSQDQTPDPTTERGESPAEVVALALGSNLGSRSQTLERARREIERRIGAIRSCSAIYETEPVGPPGQRSYLNQVVVVDSRLSPEALYAETQAIELALGRVRGERWGPRVIDVDIVLFGNRVLCTPELEIPHPRMHERAFVLIPLADVLADWVHPLRGQSVEQLCKEVDPHGVTHSENGSASRTRASATQGG